MRLSGFRAVRPVPEHAARVASVPYDVVNRAEAAAAAAANELSFLHVVRAEIDVPDDVSAYDDRVYATARANLARLRDDGVLIQEDHDAIYLYRLELDGRAQTGIVGCVHIDDYEHDRIKKHERTRPDKENDRTRHILELNADAEPVILTFRGNDDLAARVERVTAGAPLYDFTADDRVRHTVWRADHPEPFVATFEDIPAAYVADGHHRCASAWRAGCERRDGNPEHTGEQEYNWFPAVLFPAAELRILAYNRVVADLGGKDAGAVLEQLADVGTVTATSNPVPDRPGSFAIYLDGRWHALEIAADSIDRGDLIRSLDVDLLQERVLGPIFGIGDPRTDARIDFVGGIRGTAELERRVDSGDMAAAISMFPTAIEQLLAVADAGEIMPPKSTWFEPKLRSGLFVHLLD